MLNYWEELVMNYKTYYSFKKSVDNYQEEEKKSGNNISDNPLHPVYDVSDDIYIIEEKIQECYEKLARKNNK